MLQTATIKFLKDLARNNSKEWFDVNRSRYEIAKEDFIALASQVIAAHGKSDTSIVSLKAKDCIFRINRDVRFSKNKAPYKNNMAASINSKGKKSMSAGYYLHCEPGKSFIAGGIYMPMPEDLKKIRQEIDYNFDEFKKIVSAKKFKAAYKELSAGEDMKLIRPPKGYEPDNPAIEFIKLKSFIATSAVTDAELASKNLVKKIVQGFEAIQPLIQFVNRAL